jgi:hypothetical protein
MISVHSQPTYGRELFVQAWARLAALNGGSRLKAPPSRFWVETAASEAGAAWLSPDLLVHGDWPAWVMYNAPFSKSGAPAGLAVEGCLELLGGGRDAGIFLKERDKLRGMLRASEAPAGKCRQVFLVKSSLRLLEQKQRRGSNPNRLGWKPSYSADELTALCSRIKWAAEETTVVLDAACAAFQREYSHGFVDVRVAGPTGMLETALQAKKLAGFMTDEHWWGCFLTGAEETHVFHDPRRGRG